MDFLPDSGAAKAAALEGWLAELAKTFGARTLNPLEGDAGRQRGR